MNLSRGMMTADSWLRSLTPHRQNLARHRDRYEFFVEKDSE
jgi:hypothetical protein